MCSTTGSRYPSDLGSRSDRRADSAGNDAADRHDTFFNQSLEAVNTDFGVVLRVLADDLDRTAIDTACIINFLGGERHPVANLNAPRREAGQVGQHADLDWLS